MEANEPNSDSTISGDDRLDQLFLCNFGVSAEAFRHGLEAEYAQLTPQAQAEFDRVFDEVELALPDMHEALDRMTNKLDSISATVAQLKQNTAELDARVAEIEPGLLEA